MADKYNYTKQLDALIDSLDRDSEGKIVSQPGRKAYQIEDDDDFLNDMIAKADGKKKKKKPKMKNREIGTAPLHSVAYDDVIKADEELQRLRIFEKGSKPTVMFSETKEPEQEPESHSEEEITLVFKNGSAVVKDEVQFKAT